MIENKYDIAVVGDWHLAFVTASVLADVGHKVALVKPLNLDPKTWSEFPPLPVMEPGLQEMIDKNLSAKRLFFENGVSSKWQAGLVWMAVDTPVNDQDEPNVLPLIEILRQLHETQKNLKGFITSSQIPIGFCTEAEKIIQTPVAYVPENLRLGKGIETFFKADRTVIGASTPEFAKLIQEHLIRFETEFVLCNLVTAEMVKHANNAFLATSISFANELARIGEAFGVDSHLVAKALKLDKRIGAGAYVAPGLGFAGGTLPRDLRVLQKIGIEKNIPTRLVDSVLDINEATTQAIADIVSINLKTKGSKGPVLILGYTYKPDTDTLRRSLSLDLAKELQSRGFSCVGYDPIMNSKDLSGIKGLIDHKADLKEISTRPEVILLMTTRPAFKELPWSDLATQWSISTQSTTRPLVLDTQNHLNQAAALKAGFDFKKLWSPMIEARNGAQK
jgi:UDPglucose 6-dehydrogenase